MGFRVGAKSAGVKATGETPLLGAVDTFMRVIKV
jgi:hypothetical protein